MVSAMAHSRPSAWGIGCRFCLARVSKSVEAAPTARPPAGQLNPGSGPSFAAPARLGAKFPSVTGVGPFRLASIPGQASTREASTTAKKLRSFRVTFCIFAPYARRERGGSRCLLVRKRQRDSESVPHVDRLTLKHRRRIPASLERFDHSSIHEGHAPQHSAVVHNALHRDHALHHHLTLDLMVQCLLVVLRIGSRDFLRRRHGVIEFDDLRGWWPTDHPADHAAHDSTDHPADDSALDAAFHAGIFLLRLSLWWLLFRHFLWLNDRVWPPGNRLFLHRLRFWGAGGGGGGGGGGAFTNLTSTSCLGGSAGRFER